MHCSVEVLVLAPQLEPLDLVEGAWTLVEVAVVLKHCSGFD